MIDEYNCAIDSLHKRRVNGNRDQLSAGQTLSSTCCFSPGWSKFFTLAGHFSKLFKLAGLSRLEIVPNHGVSKKKKGLHLESVSNFLIFVSTSWCSLKKQFSLGISLNPRLCPVSSPCLVIEGCHYSSSTRLELCKIVQRAAKILYAGL